MVSRIEVIPSEVRGYGNIIEAKSLSDFVPVESDLVYSENVYSLTAVSGVHISLTASSSSINVGSSVTLTATVMEDDTPVTGETVSFYDGETLLGTDATDSSGVATYTTSSLTVGAHSLSAVYDEKTSNLVNVTVNKITSTVSLSASSSTITYGDSVTLSGTLSVGSGESVKIYQGSTLLDTVTSGTGGAFTKSVSGLAVGSYTFKATYDGDSTHSEASSSNVSVTVNKITPTITISVPASGTVGTSYNVTGTLSVDGSVKLYENGSLKDTLTVSSGSFSKAITQSNEGTYSYYVVFEGSSTYESVTSSTSSIVVSDTPAPTPASITLTSDKSILSYADSQSATLSATVKDSGNNPLEGVTVEFFKGSTSLGTASTNSSGVATKSYASAGVGDISLTAEVGSLVSETYSIEDCLWNWDGTTTLLDSGYVDANGWLRRNTEGQCKLNTPINLPSHFQISYTYKKTSTAYGTYLKLGEEYGTSSTNTRNYDIGNLASTRTIIRRNTDNTLLFDKTNTVSQNTEYNEVYEYNNGSHSLTHNNNTYTATDSSISMDKFFSIGIHSSGYVKNMKVKPL